MIINSVKKKKLLIVYILKKFNLHFKKTFIIILWTYDKLIILVFYLFYENTYDFSQKLKKPRLHKSKPSKRFIAP